MVPRPAASGSPTVAQIPALFVYLPKEVSRIYFEAVADDKFTGVLVGLYEFVSMRTLTTSIEHYFL